MADNDDCAHDLCFRASAPTMRRCASWHSTRTGTTDSRLIAMEGGEWEGLNVELSVQNEIGAAVGDHDHRGVACSIRLNTPFA